MFLEITEPDDGMPYLQHEYNRDGDSYRSPWTDKYFPANEEGLKLPPKLRDMEVKFNEAFKKYANLYYNLAKTSVYVMETDAENGFNAAFLIKKDLENEKHIDSAAWDSIHAVNCEMKDNKLNTEVTSTLFVTFDSTYGELGKMNLAGSCAKQTKKSVPVPMDWHKNPNGVWLHQIGMIIEQNEQELRAQVTDLYITRQRQIINTSRINEDYIQKINTQLKEMNK